MAVPARGGAPFDLKSTSLSGLALVLRTSDSNVLASAMSERFGRTPGAFNHDAVVIDLSVLPDGAETPEFAELVDLLTGHRLRVVGVRGGSEAAREAALLAGLGDVADEVGTGAIVSREAIPAVDAVARSAPAPAAAPTAALGAPTVIVDKPLRSGQQVYAKGGDLVVIATVNVGAEVIADGSIHVYGPLRGKAVAGAKGNVDARIFSTCMEPQLLAIAGTYRTTETPLPAGVLGEAAQIRLDGERLVFEPLV